MATARLFPANNSSITSTEPLEIVTQLREGLKNAANKFVYFRQLQDNSPAVWNTIRNVASKKFLSENTNFLEDYRNFFRNQDATADLENFLQHLHDTYFKSDAPQLLNIDNHREEFISFQKDKNTQQQAKKLLVLIAAEIATLLSDGLITKSDFTTAFQAAWTAQSTSPKSGKK